MKIYIRILQEFEVMKQYEKPQKSDNPHQNYYTTFSRLPFGYEFGLKIAFAGPMSYENAKECARFHKEISSSFEIEVYEPDNAPGTWVEGKYTPTTDELPNE